MGSLVVMLQDLLIADSPLPVQGRLAACRRMSVSAPSKAPQQPTQRPWCGALSASSPSAFERAGTAGEQGQHWHRQHYSVVKSCLSTVNSPDHSDDTTLSSLEYNLSSSGSAKAGCECRCQTCYHQLMPIFRQSVHASLTCMQ